MYSREKVELFLLATEDGMGPTAAAEFAGVTVSAAKKWATGHLPRSYTGGGCRIVARKPPRKEASLGPDKSIYAPPATGPLAGLNEDQIENLLLGAALAGPKAEGWDPASISNRSKCELVSVNLFFTSFAKQARRSRKGGFTGCANVFSPIPVTA